MNKMLLILSFVFIFIIDSVGQNKYIIYPRYQTYESDGQTYTYPDYVFWSNAAQWNVYPGNTINPGDTVIIESNARCIMDSVINFLPGSVLILNTDAYLFPDNIDPNSGTPQNTVSLSNFSKIINYGCINPPKLNINDSLLNYGIVSCDLDITRSGVVINNPSAQMSYINVMNNGTFINNSFVQLGLFENNNKLINNDEFNSYNLNNRSFSSDGIVIPGGKLINNKNMRVEFLDDGNPWWDFDYEFINNGLLSSNRITTGKNFVNNDTVILNGGYGAGSNFSYYRSDINDTCKLQNTFILNGGYLIQYNGNGVLLIEGNLTLKNGSLLENYSSADSVNIYNDGSVINNGTITLLDGGDGNFIFNWGKFINNGTISSPTSSWNEIANAGYFLNKGMLNSYVLWNGGDSRANTPNIFINDSTGSFNINNYLLTDNSGGSTRFNNLGVINNYSYIFESIRNSSFYNFSNHSIINNYATINPALMINYGIINNYAQINFEENQMSYFTDYKLNNYGTLYNTGSIVGTGYLFNIDGGTLINNNALISPGGNDVISRPATTIRNRLTSLRDNSSPYGCLNFTGFRGNTKYVIDISDTTQCTGHDFVSISDTLFANGRLEVSISYQPNPNDIITIIHADTVINVFDTVNISDGWEVLYNQPNKGDVSVRYGNPCNNLNSDFLQDSVSVCGSSYLLRVPNSFDSYLWNDGTIDSSTNVISSGWYSCLVTQANCLFRDSIYLSLLNADIIQNDTSLCRGASLTLNTNSSNNILWSNNTTGTSITVTPLLTTIYYATATDGVLICRDSIKVNISATLPSTPGVVSGATDICPLLGNNTISSVVNYTIRKTANANSYLWTMPLGVNLVSGQGDTAVNVTFSNSFVSGAISVKSVNACGVSTGTRTIAVYKRIASIPGAMYQSFSPLAAAVTSVCGRTSETYKIRKVAYATSYIWILSNGSFANISHTNAAGINDTATIINFQSGFTKDTLIVKSITACSVSASRTIVLNALAVPSAVSSIVSGAGNTTPCIGDVVNYFASSLVPTTAQTSVAVYRWSKPNNTTITSANTDSSVITLRFNTGFTGGNIVAKGQSACGVYGSSKTLVLQYLPPTPTAIVSGTGNYNACIGDAITYSVMVPTPSATQRAAVVFRWTKPAYTTIVSANTDSSVISLQFNTGYRGGTLSVKGQTICGALGTAKAQALTHSVCPTGITPALYTKSDITADTDLDVNIYPNPSNGSAKLKINDGVSKQHRVIIKDMKGSIIRVKSSNSNIINLEENLKAGVYQIDVYFDNRVRSVRWIKF